MRLPWDIEEDVSGRISPERSAQIIGQGGGEEREEWTIELVRSRLLEAAHGCERLSGRIGPARMKGFWPDIDAHRDMTPADRRERELAVISGTRPADRSSRSIAPHRIGPIEEAIEWSGRYLSEDKHALNRKALQIWLWCDVRRAKFGATCHMVGLSPRTARWRATAAVKAILEGVIRDGMRP
jgi:hypothetical protein